MCNHAFTVMGSVTLKVRFLSFKTDFVNGFAHIIFFNKNFSDIVNKRFSIRYCSSFLEELLVGSPNYCLQGGLTSFKIQL